MAEATKADEYRGWLYKWTNYINGYQKRWFVLQNGLLSYYRTQGEMSHTCRGTINLENSFITTEDACNFHVSNGGTGRFYLKASSEVERQKWVSSFFSKIKSEICWQKLRSLTDKNGKNFVPKQNSGGAS